MDYSHLTKEEVIDDIKNNKIKLKNLTDELKDNKDIVLEAISKNGKYLFYASKRLKDDKEIVLEAVKQNGWALIYASENLKDDKDVVLKAIKDSNVELNSAVRLSFASKRLQGDKEFLELLEKKDISELLSYKEWYKERMEVLANIRRQEDKKLIEDSINFNNTKAKKIKF